MAIELNDRRTVFNINDRTTDSPYQSWVGVSYAVGVLVKSRRDKTSTTEMGRLAIPKKKPKFGNRKTEIDGITFDSAKEARRYGYLRMLEKAGNITELRLQVPFVLVRAAKVHGRNRCARKYIADFVYLDQEGKCHVEDAKGAKTDLYLWKRHMMVTEHGIDIEEV